MGNIIKSVVECGSLYGMVCILATFVFFYATIRFVLPYIYKIVCKICNTLLKYKDIHAKACVKDASFETELHRWSGLLDSILAVLWFHIILFSVSSIRLGEILALSYSFLLRCSYYTRNRRAASLFWFILSHEQVFLPGLEYLLQAFRLRIVYTLWTLPYLNDQT